MAAATAAAALWALCGPVGTATADSGTSSAAGTSADGGRASRSLDVGVRVLAEPEDFTPGLRVETSTTFTVDLPASMVRVEHVATLTNQSPDRVTSTYVEQHYFPEYAAPVLVGATNLVAQRLDGVPLDVHVEPEGDGTYVSWALVDLAPDLFFGGTQSVRLTYDLPAQPPRSGTSAQVNQAFATFPFLTAADPGLGTVTVVVPDGLDVEVVGSTMDVSSAPGQVVHSVTGVADPGTFGATVIARDDEALVEQLAFYGDHGVMLRAWPGDAEWLAFTADLAERGLPALRDSIGKAWAQTGQLEIVETSAPYVYGYAGWYERSQSLIEVGDQLDPHVTLHEMAHAWFNEEAFAGRWVNEAFANEFAALAMADLGMERPLPQPVTPDGPGALPLEEWADVDLAAPEAEDQEAYGYNTSWWVAHQLVEELGVEGLAEVVRAATDHRSPYPTSTGGLLTTTADWRVLLDLLETVGGSVHAEPLFRDLVVTDADVAVLDQRAAARAEYADLLAEGDGWAPPAALRDAMVGWAFDEATPMIGEVSALYGRRDALEAELAQVNTEVPGALQKQFEASGDLTELDRLLGGAEGAVEAVVAAVTAEEEAGPLARVGLLLTGADGALATARAELDDGDYAAATRAAEAASEDIAGASARGLLVVGALLLVLVFPVVVVLVRRRRRTQPTPAGEPDVEPDAEPDPDQVPQPVEVP